MSYITGGQIVIIPSGDLSNQEIFLQSKSPNEAIFYQFSVANRLGPADNIVEVCAYPGNEDVQVDQITVSGQTFKARISGGIVNMKCGIQFVVTTNNQEKRSFDVTLPIAPSGIISKGFVGDYIIGNMGPIGPVGPAGKDGLQGVAGLNGETPIVQVGATETIDAGLDAKVNSSIKDNITTLDFFIPRGADGKDGGYTQADKEQVQTIIDAFGVVGDNEDKVITDINQTYTRSSSVSTCYFTVINQSDWQGKTVLKLGFKVLTAGTLSVMLVENPNSSTFKEVKSITIDLELGKDWYDLNWSVGTNQYIAIVKGTDTGRFAYSGTGVTTGLFYYYDSISKIWSSSISDLNMGLEIKVGYEVSTLNEINQKMLYLSNKKVSFLGDSMTTYQGYIPSGYATLYPKYGVDTVQKTWWNQFIDNIGATLLNNNSYSGSRVSKGGNGSLQTRLNAIDSETDLCLIFMGTNDLGNAVSFGAFDPTKTTFNTSEFTDALCNAIVTLQTNYPMTKFIWVTPLKRFTSASDNTQYNNAGQTVDTYTNRIIEVCNYYGVEYLDIRGLGINSMNQNEYLGDGLHLNASGAELLANYITNNINRIGLFNAQIQNNFEEKINDKDSQNLEALVNAFKLNENITVLNTDSALISPSVLDYCYFTPVTQTGWQGQTVTKIGINVYQEGTLTISLVENPKSVDFKIIKQIKLDLKKDQIWYDLNFEVGTQQYIAISDKGDTGQFKFANYPTSADKGFYVYAPGSKPYWTNNNINLNIGFQIKNKEFLDNVVKSSEYIIENKESLDNAVRLSQYLVGKKVSFFGDSITTFAGYSVSSNGYPNSDVKTVDQTWWKQIINKTGATLGVNNSIAASAISNPEWLANANSLLTRLQNLPTDTDLCIILMGINDFRGGVGIGTYDPTKAKFLPGYFADAVCSAMVNLHQQCPNARFVWVTPLGDYTNTSVFPSLVKNSNGNTVWDFADIIIKAAQFYGNEVIDTRYCFSNLTTNCFFDGLHPNALGMQKLSNFILNKIHNILG